MSWDRYISWTDPRPENHVLGDLLGKTITQIHWTEERLVIETAEGTVHGYAVEGDCCSYSYFHDFFGVEHLLNNGPVTEVGDVELADDDPRFSHPVTQGIPEGFDWSSDVARYVDDSVQVYGYKLTTVHPVFGEVTSVLSFRNASNGYYGGWMDRVAEPTVPDDAIVLTQDYVGA